MLKKALTITAIVLVAGLLGISVYGAHLWREIDRRFSGRLWQIPSIVYSDTCLIYPGQRIDPKPLVHKLQRLGYREVAHRPRAKGQLRVRSAAVEVFLQDLNTAAQDRAGVPVRLLLDGGRVARIERMDDRGSLPLLELEPEEIGRFYGPQRERRELVSLQMVPPHLIRAVLAAEDRRFFEHPGFDPRGILRALVVNVRSGAIRQGGSTITQQLAKNFFLSDERTLRRKFNELLMAVILEQRYSKNQILEIYLNEIYLGQLGSTAINGVDAAARHYFGKTVQSLNLAESAALAGMIRSPGRYSPRADPQRCRERRDAVLAAMQAAGWITAAQRGAAADRPVTVATQSRPLQPAPYFMDYLSRQLETLYSPADLSSMGLSIYTTLDTQVQAAAEAALERGLARLENTRPALRREKPGKRLQGAVVVLQAATGSILAMVGGRDYGRSQFNRITQSRRQPGSAFKPLVYLAGLEALTPASRLSNRPRAYPVDDKSWQPNNFTAEAPVEVSVREGLAQSYNLATVDLAMQVGLQNVVDRLESFDFSTPFKPYPSLALGAFEIIPLELARAYCVFASGGILPYPLSLKDVVDEGGNGLQQRHVQLKRVISPASAYVVTSLLRSVVREGTARGLARWNIASAVAGKTGTTNDFRDAWFVGYTPEILALVWVGFDDGTPVDVAGGGAALPIWGDLVQSLPQYDSGTDFPVPPGVVHKLVCRETGLLAEGRRCPEPEPEVFVEGHAPTAPCPLHSTRDPIRRMIDGVRELFQ